MTKQTQPADTTAPKAAKTTAVPLESAKQIALKAAIADIEKQFGAGSIMDMGNAQNTHIETFPSGSLSLDIALGTGIPKSRIIEIFGPESSGKTTLIFLRTSYTKSARSVRRNLSHKSNAFA